MAHHVSHNLKKKPKTQTNRKRYNDHNLFNYFYTSNNAKFNINSKLMEEHFSFLKIQNN